MNRGGGAVYPYCGHGNLVLVEDSFHQRTVVTCDEEEGGCCKDFVANVSVSVTVKELKIEGEEG